VADLYTFSKLLTDVAPDFVEIDGRVFLDRESFGLSVMTEKVRAYPSAREAQQWINLVPIDDLLDLISDDWSFGDPAIDDIVEVYRRSWLAIAARALGSALALSVDVLIDEESGDLILRLSQAD
jgi:hypothetical protein